MPYPKRQKSCPRSLGIYGGQSEIEEDFFRVFRSPLKILIPSTDPYLLTILSSTPYSLDTDGVVKQQP
jgi:hypothetical protein